MDMAPSFRRLSPGRCIALTSKAGDLVLDPFVGAGTTAIAAMALGRRCLGYDISEKYIMVAAQRLKAAESSQRLMDDDGRASSAVAIA